MPNHGPDSRAAMALLLLLLFFSSLHYSAKKVPNQPYMFPYLTETWKMWHLWQMWRHKLISIFIAFSMYCCFYLIMKKLMITLSAADIPLGLHHRSKWLNGKMNLYVWYQKYDFEETLHNKWHISSPGNCVTTSSDFPYCLSTWKNGRRSTFSSV